MGTSPDTDLDTDTDPDTDTSTTAGGSKKNVLSRRPPTDICLYPRLQQLPALVLQVLLTKVDLYRLQLTTRQTEIEVDSHTEI